MQGGIERRTLPATGRPGHEDHALRAADQPLVVPQHLGREAELREGDQGAAAVQDTQDDFLSPEGGEGGHTQVDDAIINSGGEAAILREAGLGDVALREDLETRDDEALHLLIQRGVGHQAAVDAVPDLDAVLARLDVDIRGAEADGIAKQDAHDLDNRSGVQHLNEALVHAEAEVF